MAVVPKTHAHSQANLKKKNRKIESDNPILVLM